MSCNLCSSSDVKIYATFPLYTLLKCSDCGLLFTDQSSVRSSFLYDKDYFNSVHTNFFATSKQGYEKYLKSSKKLKNFVHVLEKIKRRKPTGKFLDIGCATGVFLDLARKRGYDVLGVDVSSFACKYATDTFQVPTKCGKLEELHLPGKQFDIITMWDVLEHVNDPKMFLNEVSRILKDDGVIFILTINDTSLMGWLAEASYVGTFRQFKYFVRLIHPIHHNFHFKEHHLRKYLALTGFQVLSMEKSEMPIENIEGGWILKSAVWILYTFSTLLHLQHEIKVIARKNG